ncbi:glycoside hydrolase family 2 [Fusarium agapanthi]|uniref:Glycoside hydrolase family 2 n=1 Tax=Fusarium agapanthi TaxID=1803897 RepID=A0A9P5EBR2_9HYPO|nr:glycoside hydrolase family 2 [Fusarium agapanthi]
MPTYKIKSATIWTLLLALLVSPALCIYEPNVPSVRERVRLRDGWQFRRSESTPDALIYDYRPDANGTDLYVLKNWILPSGNSFIENPDHQHKRPKDEPEVDIPYIHAKFDDSDWERVQVPHDWAISGPFYTEEDPIIPGDMGRLPIQGVGWYRKVVQMSSKDLKKHVYLDIDGAMSYPMVWLNGKLLGGWPYGYNSFRLDLTDYLEEGENQLAIRVENPTSRSSRWYPGAGIYRNVWIIKVEQIHVAHWGTRISTRNVSSNSAVIEIEVQTASHSRGERNVVVQTEIFENDLDSGARGQRVATFPQKMVQVGLETSQKTTASVKVFNPKLWGPPPTQSPHLYTAVTRLFDGRELLDEYETEFGIRALVFTPDDGLHVNGQKLYLHGVNQHHDLGALGAAFNYRAAKRQLEMLRELGVNAIRMAHNPPAPELLELTDKMGFLVVDEIFDAWEIEKVPCDFHLIFKDWREPDLRSFIRRDRNHPSVVVWSVGNEVMEQNLHDIPASTRIANNLKNILNEEDNSRPVTGSLNVGFPNETLPQIYDIISLNYQGEGIRWGPAYEHLNRSRARPGQYDNFHGNFSDKLILGSEVGWSLSTRGTFTFPVTPYDSSPVNQSIGADYGRLEICGYELYSADAGSSADKVFKTQDEHPFVAGGFTWAGFDYLGEPAWPEARSAYSGIIDLAGFPKERFYLYQARWRPELPMAHIIPHWNWPDRIGKKTPVHVFSSGDEAELFINGKSQGRLERKAGQYRFRWNETTYQPGEVRVVVYKNGKEWATQTTETAGEATRIKLDKDRDAVDADGEDLVYLKATITDWMGRTVPRANNTVVFSVEGPGEIVATDNGYPADFTAFPSNTRNAFNGLALAIVRGKYKGRGSFTVKAESKGLMLSFVEVDLNSIKE